MYNWASYFPENAVNWSHVVIEMERIQRAGLLLPKDDAFLGRARFYAAAALRGKVDAAMLDLIQSAATSAQVAASPGIRS